MVFVYYKDNIKISSIEVDVEDEEWTIMDNSKKTRTPIKNIFLLSEEEFFQYSLVWDFLFPLELVLKIQNIVENYNYNYSSFYYGSEIVC